MKRPCNLISIPLAFSLRSVVTNRSQTIDLPPGGDSLPRGEGDIPRGAVALAESTLDTLVHNGAGRVGGLQVLHV